MFARNYDHWGHKGNGVGHLMAHGPRLQASRLFLRRAVQIAGRDVESPFESEGSALENHRVRRGFRIWKDNRNSS